MIKKYNKWILDNYPTKEEAFLQCGSATKKMLKEFPELIRVRGHVYTISEGERPHWWLKTDDGLIIDPTAIQFGYILEYIEWDESQKEPTGKCPNCG